MHESVTRSVVSVGEGGRGFVVAGAFEQRFVVTAAHCLPFVPPPHLARHLEEYTFKKLLARLGKKPRIWAECKFVDTMADIAVLGAPDGMGLEAEEQAYRKMTEALPALALAAPPTTSAREARRFLVGENANEAFEKRWEKYRKMSNAACGCSRSTAVGSNVPRPTGTECLQ